MSDKRQTYAKRDEAWAGRMNGNGSGLAQLTIDGAEEPIYRRALDRFGHWPVTVWDLDMTDALTRQVKQALGDDGSTRAYAWAADHPTSCYNSVSIFNPKVAALALNLWAPAAGRVLDPFGGGGTRAIMSAAAGLEYLGFDIRQPEVDATNERIERAGYADYAEVLCADACDLSAHVPSSSCDFLLTCPPYWNLEQYEGGPRDLSTMAYPEFCAAIQRVVDECWRCLRPGSAAVWVIGLHRHSDGQLAPLHHVVTAAHIAAGYRVQEEVILYVRNSGSIQRVGNFDKGHGHLIRMHEYALVYRKPA